MIEPQGLEDQVHREPKDAASGAGGERPAKRGIVKLSEDEQAVSVRVSLASDPAVACTPLEPM